MPFSDRKPKLPLLTPKITPEQINIKIKYEQIVNNLKNMSQPFVLDLFGTINIDDVIGLNIKIIGYFINHYFVYVNKLILKSGEIDINVMFYLSTGQSRGTGLENTWLPTTGISLKSKMLGDSSQIRIHKPEDEYILFYEKLLADGNYNEEYVNNDLLTYGRFMNNLNTKISKFMSTQELVNPEIFKGKSINKEQFITYDLLFNLKDDQNNIIINKQISGGYKKYYKFINLII